MDQFKASEISAVHNEVIGFCINREQIKLSQRYYPLLVATGALIKKLPKKHLGPYLSLFDSKNLVLLSISYSSEPLDQSEV